MDAASVAARARVVAARKLREHVSSSGETEEWVAGRLGVSYVRAVALMSSSITPTAAEAEGIARLVGDDG